MKPWESEPDTADFEAHGLQCAMRRGPGGHWCGYVGVEKGHPLYGLSHNAEIKGPPGIMDRETTTDAVGIINVLCASGRTKDQIEANIWPISLMLDCHGGLTYESDTLPDSKEKGKWWLGFDCAHAGDLSPKYEADKWMVENYEYRDAEYVRGICEKLAEQIARWPTPPPPRIGRG